MTVRDDPFQEIEELFDQLKTFGSDFAGSIPVDVIEEAEAVVVQADLPGRDPDDFQVQLQDERRLHIEAPAPDEQRDGEYLARERATEAVSRTVRLPTAVDEEETTASYDRGVLTIHLAKQTASEGTEIPVN